MVFNNLYRRWEKMVYGGTITRFRNAGNCLALTFDDGPDEIWTRKIMDLLDVYNASGTFFLVGSRASVFTDLVLEIVNRGHAVANHTWDHASLPSLSTAEMESQIERCQKVLGKYTELKIFRPPFGHLDGRSRRLLLKKGYQIFTWNIAPCDWENDITAKVMMNRVSEKISPGSVILLHDLIDHDRGRGREETVRLVEMLLEAYSKKFRFSSIPELMERAEPVLTYWNYYDPQYLNKIRKEEVLSLNKDGY